MAHVDWEQFDNITADGDPAFLAIFDEFVAVAEQDLAALIGATQSGHGPEALRLAHKIKGSASNFGVIQLASLAGELEDQPFDQEHFQAVLPSLAQTLHAAQAEVAARYPGPAKE